MNTKSFAWILQIYFFSCPSQSLTIPQFNHPNLISNEVSKPLETQIIGDTVAAYPNYPSTLPIRNLHQYRAGPVTQSHSCAYLCFAERPWHTYYHQCVITWRRVNNMCLCLCIPRFYPRQPNSIINGRS